jgi:hypothetical protein
VIATQAMMPSILDHPLNISPSFAWPPGIVST